MEIKFTLVWAPSSLDFNEHAKQDKAKSSRPRRRYAAAGQSEGGDSRHLSNAWLVQKQKKYAEYEEINDGKAYIFPDKRI